MGDVYHYLVSASWWVLAGLFVSTYLVANVLFALGYQAVGGVSGMPSEEFAGYFFFSVQTFATIGYGGMLPTGLGAHVLVTAESMLGLIYVAVGTGLVFAKFSRPKARVLFSEVAVVARRNGQPTLMFRMANERLNHVVEAQLKVSLSRFEVSQEGDRMRRVVDLPLVRSSSPLFILSWQAMHVIGPESPLYGATTETLAREQAEIIVTLVGLDEALGQTIHTRHSYLDTEIVWNAKLKDIIRDEGGDRVVDYTLFHEVEPLPPGEAEAKPEPALKVLK